MSGYRRKHGAEYESIKDIPRLPSGHLNDYRRAQFLGQGASRKDPEWDKQRRVMTCCGSKVYWRHKVACPKLEGTLPPD
jgi:hypothetical protein